MMCCAVRWGDEIATLEDKLCYRVARLSVLMKIESRSLHKSHFEFNLNFAL